MFGGQSGGVYSDETWVYDLSDNIWAQDSNTTQPSPRHSHAISETSMDGSSSVLLFGGWDRSILGDTWTFGGGDYPLVVELMSFVVE